MYLWPCHVLRPSLYPSRVPYDRILIGLLVAVCALPLLLRSGQGAEADHFAYFELPQDWQERYWADPDVQALMKLEPKALAELVPEQAGFRYCRCPSCEATEAEDPLRWSFQEPEVLTCRQCGAQFPNDDVPAEVDKKIPEEAIEVLPGIIHRYAYHLVPPIQRRHPDERIYLDAKRDYLIREFLAKTTLYAALRYRDQPADAKDPDLARRAAVLLLRFAQVYPNFATHFDQLDQPKYLQPANLLPPYRTHFRTGKWDWSGALDVPLNLLIAYSAIRNDPAIEEAGELLDDPQPRRTIEESLFRTSAEFVLGHPDPFDEMSLYANRGILAVGRLLDEPRLIQAALDRMDALALRGFYHDGLWRDGDPAAHRRIVSMIDAWFLGLVPGPESHSGQGGVTPSTVGTSTTDRPGEIATSILSLARSADSASLFDPAFAPIQQASWPASGSQTAVIARRPRLLGGAGMARLAVGDGENALDVELRGFGDTGAPHFGRLALRVAVGGRTVLGDLDDLPPSAGGWEQSSASHCAVVVDGLNQRETPEASRISAPASDILFFAADPDFQVATLADRSAYPLSTTRYRHTVALISDAGARYGVSLFEVKGGLLHDQFFHAAPGTSGHWQLPIALGPGPKSLLPAGLRYLPTARADDGRWFIQAYGAFTELAAATVDRATIAKLDHPTGPSLQLHLLNDAAQTLLTAVPIDPSRSVDPSDQTRGTLIIRRKSPDNEPLSTLFVTLFESANGQSGIRRVGRVDSPPGTAILILDTAAGTEFLVFNDSPGIPRDILLPDGQTLRTDGLLVRAHSGGLTLAGGTFADWAGRTVGMQRLAGTILNSERLNADPIRGSFEVKGPLPVAANVAGSLAGRALLIRHGDGTARGWTISHIEHAPDGKGNTRLYVFEEPGFQVDPLTGEAIYYQYPGRRIPGPHEFTISQIAR